MLLLAALAHADEQVVVHTGDTIESIAATLGDPALATAIRIANGLGDDGVPEVGAVLHLPGRLGLRATGGVLLAAYGSGTVSLPGGGAGDFLRGVVLPEGAVVCTAADSFATVRLAVAQEGRWHDDVNLLGNTCVAVESAVAAPSGRSSVVAVQRGSIAVRSAEPGHSGAVTVKTAFGTTSGASGGFRVHVEENASRTEALSSPVAVFGAGTELALEAGQGSRVRQGEAPSAPVQLLVPGMPASPDDGAALRVPAFTWGEVDRSLGYRVEVSTAPDFSELVVVQDVPAAEWAPERLLLPFRVAGIWWRVATYDRLGFLGIPSEERSVVFPAGVGP